MIEQDGTIIYVNRACKQFSKENNLSDDFIVGSNYLNVCSNSAAAGDRLAAEVASGIRDVACGLLASFYFEYPCRRPDTKRRFMMRVTPLNCHLASLLVIYHQNITERKLIEERWVLNDSHLQNRVIYFILTESV